MDIHLTTQDEYGKTRLFDQLIIRDVEIMPDGVRIDLVHEENGLRYGGRIQLDDQAMRRFEAIFTASRNMRAAIGAENAAAAKAQPIIVTGNNFVSAT